MLRLDALWVIFGTSSIKEHVQRHGRHDHRHPHHGDGSEAYEEGEAAILFLTFNTKDEITMSDKVVLTEGNTNLALFVFLDGIGGPANPIPSFPTPPVWSANDPTLASLTPSADGLSTTIQVLKAGSLTLSVTGTDSNGKSWSATGTVDVTDGAAVSAIVQFSSTPPAPPATPPAPPATDPAPVAAAPVAAAPVAPAS